MSLGQNIFHSCWATWAQQTHLIPVVHKPRNKGLLWWHSGGESACQHRGHGLDSWSGRIPHALEQLISTCATIPEPVLWSLGNYNYWAHVPRLLKPMRPRAHTRQGKPPQRGAYALQRERSPCSLKLEKSPRSNKDPAKNLKILL